MLGSFPIPLFPKRQTYIYTLFEKSAYGDRKTGFAYPLYAIVHSFFCA